MAFEFTSRIESHLTSDLIADYRYPDRSASSPAGLVCVGRHEDNYSLALQVTPERAWTIPADRRAENPPR
jgi:hypothetical protein